MMQKREQGGGGEAEHWRSCSLDTWVLWAPASLMPLPPPRRDANVPLPHRVHGTMVQPAGVHGLLLPQRHLHRQPGQPAQLPLPARIQW